ncbi:MAG: glycosyltransferase [Myxococcales bacterium]
MPRRLRIVFVADTAFSDSGGGVVSARRVIGKLREFHDVVLVSADASGPSDLRLPGFVLPVRPMRLSGFIMARPDRAALRRTLEGADVVHLQFPFWLSFAALAEAKALRLPAVAAFHVQPENVLWSIGLHSPRLARLLYRAWILGYYDRADTVICPTRFAETKLRACGLRAATQVVSNGIDLPAEPPPAPARPADGRFRLLAVGRLAAEKRQDLLLAAAARSRHRERLEITLAGAGPREEALRRLAARLGLRVAIGFLPRELLLRHLANSELLVHCGEVELEGMAVLEALAQGLPALVAEGPETAAAELAPGGEFRFPAGDAAALAARIDELVEHPALLSAGRARGLAIASARSLDRSVEQLVELYRRSSASRSFPALSTSLRKFGDVFHRGLLRCHGQGGEFFGAQFG